MFNLPAWKEIWSTIFLRCLCTHRAQTIEQNANTPGNDTEHSTDAQYTGGVLGGDTVCFLSLKNITLHYAPSHCVDQNITPHQAQKKGKQVYHASICDVIYSTRAVISCRVINRLQQCRAFTTESTSDCNSAVTPSCKSSKILCTV